MKKHLFYLFLLIPSLAPAQLLLSDFSSIATQAYFPFNDTWSNPVDQFAQGAGFISITSVSGGDPTGEGGFHANIAGSMDGSTPVDLSVYSQLSLTARIDAGNASGFTVILIRDTAFEIIGAAQFLSTDFNESTFSTATAEFETTGPGDITEAAYWTIGGDGLSGSYRMSLDHLSAGAVPEPSTCMLLGVSLLVLCTNRARVKDRLTDR